ncbi:MAG: polyprenol monophosphomannose synthase [Actinomycetota bacterium]|nr:MAG: polyprenol monophosphomannose synthase [Actinomycetota bacterium]
MTAPGSDEDGPDTVDSPPAAPADLGRVLVVIPTYDERDSLDPILDRVRDALPDGDVLVVDDNSPDGTGALADQRAASDERIHVLHRPSKQGLGAAYLDGFGWALDHGYDVIVEMDADGSHPADRLPALVDALRTADLALGSRYVPGGRVENWSKVREVISRGGNLYTRVALGLPLQDATGGFRAFRASTLKALDLGTVASQGYCFQVDLARRALARGLTVVEVPITFVERAAGTSKMSRQILVEALWRVTVWGAQERLESWRRRSSARQD